MQETEEQQYERSRCEKFLQLGLNPYPHKFTTTITFSEFIQKYQNLEKGSHHPESPESVAGRVLEKRIASKKLIFYTVTSNGFKLQYVSSKNEYTNQDKFEIDNEIIHRGDIVGINGFAGKTKNGELSVFASELILLAPCYKFLPKQFFGMSDVEVRMKKRYMDMIANPEVIQTIKTRSKIINEIRSYLNNLDFVEVETPVLSSNFGGAVAKPFITYHNDLDQDMYLRIAPELYLKKLVIGGLDRVYEIGKQFRNEFPSPRHQCEFTSVEFYMTYVDYNDLMLMVEDLLSGIVTKIYNTHIISYANKAIDFTPPFKRINIIDELELQTSKLFNHTDFTSDAFKDFLLDIVDEFNIKCEEPKTIPRLLDKLIGHFIEPQCINPTFLTNHPLVMSPLAKHDRNDSRLSERFELFINGIELANAYTELNNHFTQENAFRVQQIDKGNGDEEIPLPDEDYIEAMRYGLPSTGGCGIGIDRLVMFMTDNMNIREVVTFPL